MGPSGACGKTAQVPCVPELASGPRDLCKAPVKAGGDGKRIQREGEGKKQMYFWSEAPVAFGTSRLKFPAACGISDGKEGQEDTQNR